MIFPAKGEIHEGGNRGKESIEGYVQWEDGDTILKGKNGKKKKR